MQKFRTVRISYLYIFLGSALLSAAFLFAVYKITALLYTHYSRQSGSLFVELIHWVINHIGKIPCAILLYLLLFCGLFILRSKKIADDLHVIMVSTSELADRGAVQDIRILSGGELGEIAANLNRIRSKRRVNES